jgi:hypothetical protein
MTSLPDDALVVRGGQNLPENFTSGAGVTVQSDGRLDGLSVNAASGMGLAELTAPNPATGYPGIPHNRVGVTTVGRIRAAGGNVVSSPTRGNPHHATVSGLTAYEASALFRPTVPNPNRIVT